jgi:flavin prenyltransferase
LIVGLTGATGPIFGVRLLKALKERDIESHLVISNWERRTIGHETPYTVKKVGALATV